MTRTCAKDLTDRINSTSEDLAGMLKRAHDEKAWQALGYTTWNDYVKAEIKLCKSRVFQLLDYETIRQELAESTIVDLPLPTKESVTRELKKAPPAERAEKYAKAVVLSGGKEPTAKTVKVVVEQQEHPIKQAEAKVIEGEVVNNKRRELTPAMQHAHKIIDMLAELSKYDPQESKRAFAYIVKSMVLHGHMSYAKRDQIKKETGIY